MNGNFDSPLTFLPGTNVLAMAGPLVAQTDRELSMVVRVEVDLLDPSGKVVESCNSNGNGFSPAPAPGSHWAMAKSTNKVASGQTVTAHGKAFDRSTGNKVADWQAQVAIA
jgi:hypothetical protein